MYAIEINQLSKNFGEDDVINVEELNIETGQRIGIVGANGAGKTTLLKLISKEILPDAGQVKVNIPMAYWSQREAPVTKIISQEMASRFGVPVIWRNDLSGGEKARFKAAVAFQHQVPLMLVDEPTTNLDMEGIEQLEQHFLRYKGTLLLVSHDRQLLDALCHHILEVEAGKIRLYKGNYSEYAHQKEAELNRQQVEFETYQQEKRRLKKAILETKEKSAGIRKTPSRMGNSEARLHKMGNQSAKKNLDQSANRLKTRMKQLEVKEKPLRLTPIQLELEEENSLHKRDVVQVEQLSFGYGNLQLFHKASFRLENNSRTALLGPNGCGKSTLIRLILKGHPDIRLANKARVGYFDQQMKILNTERTILENVMEDARMSETTARILLAKFLFPGEDVHKKVEVISGGEGVKVSLAKILLQGFNLLILDEPTNHLDIPSMNAVEEALKAYEGTLLLVSHDRHLITKVANRILLVENQQVHSFIGSYENFRNQREKQKDLDFSEAGKQKEERLMVLENRMTQLISRLSAPSAKEDIVALDAEYQEVLNAIKALKGSSKA